MGYGGYGSLGGCCCKGSETVECTTCNTGTMPKSWMVEISNMPETPCTTMWNSFTRTGGCLHINGTYFIDVTKEYVYGPGTGTFCGGEIIVPVTCGGVTTYARIALMFRGNGDVRVSCELGFLDSFPFDLPWQTTMPWPRSVMFFDDVVAEVDLTHDCSLFDGWTKTDPIFHEANGTSFQWGRFCESSDATVRITAL
jgi:hypothetical protein